MLFLCDKMGGTSLLVLKDGGSLVDEGGHALLLVLGREGGSEDPPLEADSLGEGELKGNVDGLLGERGCVRAGRKEDSVAVFRGGAGDEEEGAGEWVRTSLMG